MGFRGKVLLVLVVYFAGFATAIYALAPADPKVTSQAVTEPLSFPQSFTKSDQFALSMGEKIRKAFSTGKELAHKVSSTMNTGSAPAADKG